MDKKQQELAGLLGMIGAGGGVVGGLAGTGSLISNAIGQNRQIDARFQDRILNKTKGFNLSDLNPQQISAVKRLVGDKFPMLDMAMPVSELPININGKDYPLKEILFDKDIGIASKLKKTPDMLRMREAINQLVVPAQQAVLEEAQAKVGNRQTIKNVASQHVAAGGQMPKANRAYGNFDMVGGQSNASALRQGALGSTSPTSSLITNEGFAEGPKLTFNEIAQRLPTGHPSYTRGVRTQPPPPPQQVAPPPGPVAPPPGAGQLTMEMTPAAPPPPPSAGASGPIPLVPPPSAVAPPPQQVGTFPPRSTGPMATQSNDFKGPENYAEREAAYRDLNKQLRPGRLKRFFNPAIRVPGTGMQAVKAGARNMVRGAVRSKALKVGGAATLAGGALGYLVNNYTADKIVDGIVEENNLKPDAPNAKPAPAAIAPPNAFDQRVLDRFDAKYSNVSKEAKLAEAKRIASKPGDSGYLQARMWLKYNAPNK